MIFPKSFRLRKRPEFLRLRKEGRRVAGQFICVDWRISSQPTRLGITASGHYGNAPQRNRFKRIVREAFRISRPGLPPRLDVHVAPRQRAKRATMEEIKRELVSLLKSC